MVSVILTGLNEAENPVFWDNIQRLRESCDLIVVDSGSRDGSFERFKAMGLTVFIQPGATREQCYLHGLDQARGDSILLVPSRARVTEEMLSALGGRGWGNFSRGEPPLFKRAPWYMRFVVHRFDLDHCVFFSADLKDWARRCLTK